MSGVFILYGEAKPPKRKEALRYLGIADGICDEATAALLDACEKELLSCASPRACYTEGDVVRKDDGNLEIFGIEIKSRSLSKNLDGCSRVFLFAATLGAGVDRLLSRYGAVSASKAVALDALASALIEDFCDEVENTITHDLKKRPRFSAGYGDLDLSLQKELFGVLSAPKSIGLTLSDSYMMIPTKSVSAIVGILDN